MCKEAALDFSRDLWKKGDSFLKLGIASRVVSRSFFHQQSGLYLSSDSVPSYWHVFQATESLCRGYEKLF